MSSRALAGTGILALAALGCGRKDPAAPPTLPPPVVTVATPEEETVTDYRDFTGRTVAVDSVVVRARVTGYLDKVLFKEGADVQAGDLLYEIDPRPYEAALAQAEGNVAAAEARLVRLEADLGRARTLFEEKVISQEGLDTASSERAETVGTLQSLRAAVERAKLDLEFTHIKAPISGRTGERRLSPGNLVMADDTALTSIVTLDPIHAEFDVDERSVLLYRERIREKQVKSARETEVGVLLGLTDETGFPHTGVIDFVDNQLDATSGTIRARAVFPNPERVLSPGLFVRIRVPFSQPHRAILLDERALSADQRGWYVFVVDAEGLVQYRPVEVGERENGRAVIEKGLEGGERVIVNGIQRARPGAKVDARTAEKPAAAGTPAAARTDQPATKGG
jgi:RND family efflux transporter MFP subunit